MGTNGCLTNFNVSLDLTNYNMNFTGNPQRYTQYERQFIDRNSDADGDNGDEDGVDGIVNDDDDLHIGIGPQAFPA